MRVAIQQWHSSSGELVAAEGSSVQALIEEGNGLLFQARGVTINDGSSPP